VQIHNIVVGNISLNFLPYYSHEIIINSSS
jgi:hypothetical protein